MAGNATEANDKGAKEGHMTPRPNGRPKRDHKRSCNYMERYAPKIYPSTQAPHRTTGA